MIRIAAACSPGEVRVAAADGDTLLDYAVWRPGRPDGVGDVWRGRVLAHVASLAGAFVGLDETEGFLPDSEGAKGLAEGAAITVRITRAAQGGKGPRLSAQVEQQPGPPGLASRGPSAVQRLAALYPGAPVLVDDPALAASLRPALGPRLDVAASVHRGLEDEIEALALPEAMLPGGARATFHPTPALHAIDVDGAAATADRRPKALAQHAANQAAVPELARQIRLRNLSGAILIDLAGMSLKRRATLGPAFIEALAQDPLRPRFLGFSGLGLAEIMRPRVHPPMHELLAGPHAAALAALRVAMQEGAATPHIALVLRAAPDVIAALAADPVALPDLARRTGRAMIPVPDPALPACGWTLERLPRA